MPATAIQLNQYRFSQNGVPEGYMSLQRSRNRFIIAWRRFLFRWLSLLAVATAAGGFAPLPTTPAGATGIAPLTLAERTACVRAVEDVFWQHRLWPTENPGPKPSLDAVFPPAALEARVTDSLRLSNALAVYWQQPITGAMLQVEVERMARDTRQPEVLREIWQALGHDPRLVAECLARPALVERMARRAYAFDPQFHGALRAQAVTALAAVTAPDGLAALATAGAQYGEVAWVRRDPAELATDGAQSIAPSAWDARLAALARLFDAPATPPVGRVSALHEDDRRFYAVAVLSLEDGRLRVATVEWAKQPFDDWWQRVRAGLAPAATALSYADQLPRIAPQAPGDFAWTPTAGLPEGGGSAVWTGAEVIIWGGANGLGGKLNSGSRYNPATDTWRATPAAGALAARTHTRPCDWRRNDRVGRLRSGLATQLRDQHRRAL
jgi:hypothetical protein